MLRDDPSGLLSMRPREIARNYTTTVNRFAARVTPV
jgi:hypothetical protein